jgi:hypothetical protein
VLGSLILTKYLASLTAATSGLPLRTFSRPGASSLPLFNVCLHLRRRPPLFLRVVAAAVLLCWYVSTRFMGACGLLLSIGVGARGPFSPHIRIAVCCVVCCLLCCPYPACTLPSAGTFRLSSLCPSFCYTSCCFLSVFSQGCGLRYDLFPRGGFFLVGFVFRRGSASGSERPDRAQQKGVSGLWLWARCLSSRRLFSWLFHVFLSLPLLCFLFVL